MFSGTGHSGVERVHCAMLTRSLFVHTERESMSEYEGSIVYLSAIDTFIKFTSTRFQRAISRNHVAFVSGTIITGIRPFSTVRDCAWFLAVSESEVLGNGCFMLFLLISFHYLHSLLLAVLFFSDFWKWEVPHCCWLPNFPTTIHYFLSFQPMVLISYSSPIWIIWSISFPNASLKPPRWKPASLKSCKGRPRSSLWFPSGRLRFGEYHWGIVEECREISRTEDECLPQGSLALSCGHRFRYCKRNINYPTAQINAPQMLQRTVSYASICHCMRVSGFFQHLHSMYSNVHTGGRGLLGMNSSRLPMAPFGTQLSQSFQVREKGKAVGQGEMRWLQNITKYYKFNMICAFLCKVHFFAKWFDAFSKVSVPGSRSPSRFGVHSHAETSEAPMKPIWHSS